VVFFSDGISFSSDGIVLFSYTISLTPGRVISALLGRVVLKPVLVALIPGGNTGWVVFLATVRF
jgi:hypothetical protein